MRNSNVGLYDEVSIPPTTERPFTRLTEDQAAEILESIYGIAGCEPPVRLATERDDTFHIRADGAQYIFKVAHPAEDPQVINLQTAALKHAAQRDPELPLQSVIGTLDGEQEPLIATTGVQRVARLLTYLEGELLRNCRPTPEQLQECGRVQAGLVRALADFDHPVASRHMLFDLKNFGELRDVAVGLDDSRLNKAFTWHDQVLMPRAGELPSQVLHTDFGLDNVVVDPASSRFVVGVLDFGDVVRTWRAADLASGLASQVAVEGDAWDGPAQMLEGYQSVISLEPVELELLPGIVAMRIAQRILMGERLSASLTGNVDYLRRNLDLSYRQLDNLVY